MTIKKFLHIVPVILSIYLSACTDEPSNIGSELLGQDVIIIEQINSLTDTMSQTSSSTLKYVPLGSSNRLLLGRHANVQASFLIRYSFSFPDSLKQDIKDDSIVVSSAKVKLLRTYTFGDTNSVLDINVEKVLSSWSSAGFIADSLVNLQTTAIAVDSMSVTDTLTSFKIDNAVALEWLKTAADPTTGNNYGLYLKPGPSANKVYGYQALIASAQNIPQLELIIQKPGFYTDTLFYYSAADAGILQNIAPYPTGEFITIQAGLKIMSYLKFDISSLPQYAVINKAELILTSDTTQNIYSSDASNRIAAYVPRDTSTLDSIASSTPYFTKSGGTYTGNITALVQDWLVTRSNRGLVLTTSNELNGLERFIIWGSNASDPALRPRLVITYTNKL